MAFTFAGSALVISALSALLAGTGAWGWLLLMRDAYQSPSAPLYLMGLVSYLGVFLGLLQGAFPGLMSTLLKHSLKWSDVAGKQCSDPLHRV